MKPCLLVIDDEPVILELISEVLDEHRVITAATAAEARAIVDRGEPFDVAIVDKNLPDGSGLDVLRWLRERRPDSDALVMTGYPSMDSAVEAIAAGACDYLIKPMRDIAEMRLRVNNAVSRVRHRRAEQELTRALKDSEQQYRDLFETTPDAVVVLDAETRVVVDANRAAERLYGRSSAELRGKTTADLTSAQPPPVMQGALIVRRERRADGSTVSVEVTTTTTKRHARDIVVEVVRDISERERAETERLQLEQRLVRTGRLEALGRLAAGIAHDFNNLLCIISVGGDLAAEAMADDADAARDELSQIKAAVQSATALTRQLLSFSGRQLTRPQVVDVNAHVESVARMLERTLGARIKLVVELAAVPLTTLIDPSQLEQVITNLAVNGRDAMPKGGTITLTTRACAGADGAPGIGLTVRDTGSGIPPEIVASIFEPFFTTKGPEKGTGLGLATVLEIVRRAGGSIEVTSTIDVGTEFAIWMPTAEGAVHQTSKISSVVPAGRGETVLLVEDDPRVREATRRVLIGGGYAVHEARDGEEALAHVTAGGKVDLVVADVELPGMSGIDCAREITERNADARVMYTSGMTSDPRLDSTTRGSAFLPKPYTPDELMRSVRKALGATR
jgi:PAS domain S-box-containing protein